MSNHYDNNRELIRKAIQVGDIATVRRLAPHTLYDFTDEEFTSVILQGLQQKDLQLLKNIDREHYSWLKGLMIVQVPVQLIEELAVSDPPIHEWIDQTRWVVSSEDEPCWKFFRDFPMKK